MVKLKLLNKMELKNSKIFFGFTSIFSKNIFFLLRPIFSLEASKLSFFDKMGKKRIFFNIFHIFNSFFLLFFNFAFIDSLEKHLNMVYLIIKIKLNLIWEIIFNLFFINSLISALGGKN